MAVTRKRGMHHTPIVRKPMKPKCQRYKISKKYKMIAEMLEKHGKIRVVFQNFDRYGNEYQQDFRRRILKDNGDSQVAYMTNGHTKYSGYSSSCFLSNRNEKTLKETLRCMRLHDSEHIMPVEIHYGWFFRKKITI